MGYDLLPALCSASCDITHETGGTTCNGHCALHLVISLTRQVVRFVTHIVFRILCYHTRNRGYALLRALGSASCDITHETGGTTCNGHCALHLVISLTRQVVRFVTHIVFRILCYHTRNRGYALLRALGSASCDITHETGGIICYVHCALHLLISPSRQVVRFVMHIVFCILRYHTRNPGYDLLLAFGSASCEITHETGETICFVRWVLHFVISPRKRRWLQVVTGLGFCIWRSHTGAGVRFVTGIMFCIL